MILHINTGKEWRGGENQTLNLISGLATKNIKQAIVLQPNSPLHEKIQNQPGIKIIPLTMRSEFDWNAIREIRKIIQNESITLVHTHTAQAHSLAFFAKKKSDTWKLIVSRRVDFRTKKNIFSQWKYGSPLVDMFIGVSKRIRDILIDDGIDPGRTMAIHSGVDLSRFNKMVSRDVSKKEILHKELKIDSKACILGITAALVDHKDFPTLLRAVAMIPQSLNVRLLVLGVGELQSKLESLTKDLGIADRVFFLGFKQDVIPYLNCMDIFCISSKEEGLGTSVLDAMAVGLPVVATRGGGIPEMVVHDEGGYLVDVGDSEGFSNALVRLIQDDNLRIKFGRFNKSRVQDFSIQNTVNETYRLYYSFLGRSLSTDAPYLTLRPAKKLPSRRKPSSSAKTNTKPLNKVKTESSKTSQKSSPKSKKHAKKN